jgi:hypothetical protein
MFLTPSSEIIVRVRSIRNTKMKGTLTGTFVLHFNTDCTFPNLFLSAAGRIGTKSVALFGQHTYTGVASHSPQKSSIESLVPNKNDDLFRLRISCGYSRSLVVNISKTKRGMKKQVKLLLQQYNYTGQCSTWQADSPPSTEKVLHLSWNPEI